MSVSDILGKAKRNKLLQENKQVKDVVDIVVSEEVAPVIKKLNDKIDGEVDKVLIDLDVLEENIQEQIRDISLTPGPKGEDGDKGEKGDKPVAGKDYPLPKDGEDYNLTENDKKDIANLVEVPVVEKVIEKREVIIEPKVTNEIKEVAKYENPLEIANKLNTLEEKVDVGVIKGLRKSLANLDKQAKQYAGGGSLGVLDEGVLVQRDTKTLDFVGNSVTVTGSGRDLTVTIADSGESNTASNVGTGSNVFKQKTGVDLEFRSIVQGTGMTITENTNDITIATTAEANTASNLTGDEGIFAQKNGVDLEFKSLVAGTNITLSSDANGITIDAAGGIAIGDTITSATQGSVLFAGAAGVLAQDNTNFFWDDTNDYLGLGINTPAAHLHAVSGAATDITAILQYASSQSANVMEIRDSGGTARTYFDPLGALILTQQGANSRQSAVDFADFGMNIVGTTNIFRFQGSFFNANNNTTFGAVDGSFSIRHSTNNVTTASAFGASVEIRMGGGSVTDVKVFSSRTSVRSTAGTVNRVAHYDAFHLSTSTATQTITSMTFFNVAAIQLNTEDITSITWGSMVDGSNFSTGTGTTTNLRGFVCEDLTFGTSINTPIWLQGDGVGGAIAFGSGTSGSIDGHSKIYDDGSNIIIDPDVQSATGRSVYIGTAGDANIQAGTGLFLAPTATDVPLTAQAAASQTASTFEIKNSGGSVLTNFDEVGALVLTSQGVDSSRQAAVDFANFSMSLTAVQNIFRFQGAFSSVTGGAELGAVEGSLSARHGANTLTSLRSFVSFMDFRMTSTGNITTVQPFYSSTETISNANTTVISILDHFVGIHNGGGGTGEISNYSTLRSTANLAGEFIDTMIHLNIQGATVSSGQLNTHYGLYMANIANGGVRNRGIFLNGDGVGSEVTFGAATGGDAQMYYDGTDMIIDPDTTGSGKVLIGTTGDNSLECNNLETNGGRLVNVTRVTATPYTVLATDHEIFVDTDSADVVVNLPAGVAKTTYRIINVGSSSNQAQVTPNGAENLLGANSAFSLNDGESLIITYEATEGWY